RWPSAPNRRLGCPPGWGPTTGGSMKEPAPRSGSRHRWCDGGGYVEERLPGERLAELVELGDPAALLRAVDGLCASRDWDGLVDLRRRLEGAGERGRPPGPGARDVE